MSRMSQFDRCVEPPAFRAAAALDRRAVPVVPGERKLRVLLDGRMFVGRFSGVARVVICLIREFARNAAIEPVALLSASDDGSAFADLGVETLRCDFDRDDRDPVRRRRWEEARLATWIDAARADVFHATWNHGVPANCPTPSVLTIHDLIPWNTPITSGTAFVRRRAYRRSIRDSASRADRITTVSEFTRDEVLRTLRLSPDRVETVHNGVDAPSSTSVEPGHAARPYVLYVGGHEPRKNVHLALRAIASYGRRHADDLEFHLTGSRESLTAKAASVLESIVRPERIHFLGSPTDDELHDEFAGATSLLMLSSSEGFGLPVLEAMARGCPVIAAPLAALPEVGGDAACYVDPNDADAVADAIHRFRTDPTLRAARVLAGLDQAKRFSWSESARRIEAVYRSAVGTPQDAIACACGS